MGIQLRTARPKDVNQIVAIKRLAWPHEDCNPVQVEAVVAVTPHQTHVVEIEGRLVGFVDGFLTHDAAGRSRWEVDLLAVHPDYQGRGLGSRLISASTRAGIDAGAARLRSLIHVDNLASAGAFSRSGYKPQPGEYTLVVLSQTAGQSSDPTPRVDLHFGSEDSLTLFDKPYLVPVSTFNYTGLWQESHFTPQGFAAACLAFKACGCDLVGATISFDDAAALAAAAQAGFELVGNYRWWVWFGV